MLTRPLSSTVFGDIVVSCLGGGTGCASVPIPSGLFLTINVTQTFPTAAGPTGIPSATVVGIVSGTTSSAVLTWPLPNTINLGPISYGIVGNPLSLAPPSVAGGDTVVLGLITDSTLPEPSMAGVAVLVAAVLAPRFRRVR